MYRVAPTWHHFLRLNLHGANFWATLYFHAIEYGSHQFWHVKCLHIVNYLFFYSINIRY